MSTEPRRILIIDPVETTRAVLARRLRAQGYEVDEASDPATGADMALCSPPSAVVADLWMTGVSGLQVCRLLRSEPATAGIVIVLSSEVDEPRNRFWADRAGANAYVPKRRTGEIVRTLSKAIASSTTDDFFMQLSGGTVDIRDRIARQLDAALFDSVLAAEVRSLGTAGSLDRLFDLFVQFMSQVARYRWLAISTERDGRLAIHHAVGEGELALAEIEGLFGDRPPRSVLRVEDDDAVAGQRTVPLSQPIPFGAELVGKIAICPSSVGGTENLRPLLQLVARELGGPIRMASLVEESERLASTDSLTGLMNRRSFTRVMGSEIERAHRYDHPLSLVLVDVDHFKSINDTHGHAAGDRVLAALGQLLGAGSLRTSDVAARWGGEEFVVAYLSTGLEGAKIAAERLRASIENLIVENDRGERIPLTASLGIAVFVPREDFATLVDRADRGMYRSKSGGRNRVTLQVDEPSEAPTALPATLIMQPEPEAVGAGRLTSTH